MKVLLTGGGGMLGRAVLRSAAASAPGWTVFAPSRAELDLTDRAAVRGYLDGRGIDLVIHAAAKVGGIRANMADQAGFLTENMLMNVHVIEEARRAGIPRLVNLGSSCMYPRDHRMPLVEEDILAGPLEPTNEGYALAKIAAARLCAHISAEDGVAYRTFIPCNLYGPGDRYDPVNGHLLASIILKISAAMARGEDTVEIWGDGTVRREFLYVDDLAAFIVACADVLASMPDCLNTGAGEDRMVNEYYRIVADVLGYRGTFGHDLSAPVGMTRKLMDSSRAAAFGWRPETPLADGIRRAVEDFQAAAAFSR